MSNADKVFSIRAEWDADANVWYVADSDVPGLATEAPTVPELVAKLRVMVPELVELNGCPDHGSIPFELLARYQEIVHSDAA